MTYQVLVGGKGGKGGREGWGEGGRIRREGGEDNEGR